MKSPLFLVAPLASAVLSASCAPAHSESLPSGRLQGIVGTMNMQNGIFKPNFGPAPSASAAPAAVANYGGTVVVKITAANKSGVPTTAKLNCGAAIVVFGTSLGYQILEYMSPAQITPTTVSCTVIVPYVVPVSTPTATLLGTLPFIASGETGVAAGLAFVELPATSMQVPANGTITTQTFSTVL